MESMNLFGKDSTDELFEKRIETNKEDDYGLYSQILVARGEDRLEPDSFCESHLIALSPKQSRKLVDCYKAKELERYIETSENFVEVLEFVSYVVGIPELLEGYEEVPNTLTELGEDYFDKFLARCNELHAEGIYSKTNMSVNLNTYILYRQLIEKAIELDIAQNMVIEMTYFKRDNEEDETAETFACAEVYYKSSDGDESCEIVKLKFGEKFLTSLKEKLDK